MSQQKNKMSNKHLILMILGCVVPMGLFFVLFALGIPLNKVLLFALILLCPLSHIFMMRGMKHHGHDGHASESTKKDISVNRSDL
ncbi:MAG: DUF2933 domain-containing protein [Actinobacteria bacterium]|nr:DUF2933 domain-containing protein [Actinomycetota bacterium]